MNELPGHSPVFGFFCSTERLQGPLETSLVLLYGSSVAQCSIISLFTLSLIDTRVISGWGLGTFLHVSVGGHVPRSGIVPQGSVGQQTQGGAATPFPRESPSEIPPSSVSSSAPGFLLASAAALGPSTLRFQLLVGDGGLASPC